MTSANGLDQGCATGGPQATTWPAKSFGVALVNTLIFRTVVYNPPVISSVW